MSEWGNPPFNTVPHTEYIGVKEQTRRIETSQYPEERKSTETPLVVASERGLAQWQLCNKRKYLERYPKVGDRPVRVKSTVVLE